MVAADRQRFQYRVDGNDNIVWVNSWWLAFARENDAIELANATLVGKNLWDCIADKQTRELYQDVHARVRGKSETIVVPFRCDSPTLQREMQLLISGSAENDELFYEGRMLRATPTRYFPLLDARQPRDTSFLSVCSCCKRVLLESHGWLSLTDVCEKLRLDNRQKLPRWQQTLCARCRECVHGSVN